ncbi:TetR/AcrR family transcriptional regulator [Corynebacterium aquilae]|uniref:HTH tetR-type domain-containing protein n=1 Tax=Corynebacterium aquilae DSM 44791 TaxID=1431546 RepID=A0A1L7CHR9_9CORY|nr:TetR family transcriptional regulator C-terminal domain-containing protein [Corynebacterium aquilae]APT85406.1 hypothetical protein CAQU_10495 [Corynebacterium aquilae DSM 44791]
MDITREYHFTHAAQHIADAALTVLVRDGFDALSVRTVAKQADVAPGTVQYHMGTRDELIAKAFVRSIQRQQQRTAAAAQHTTKDGSFALVLAELLPIGTQQREDAATWVIIGAAASTRQWLAELYNTELEYFQTRVQHYLRDAEAQGVLREGLSPQRGARLITALVNGLTLDSLNNPGVTREDIIGDLEAGLSLLRR